MRANEKELNCLNNYTGEVWSDIIHYMDYDPTLTELFPKSDHVVFEDGSGYYYNDMADEWEIQDRIETECPECGRIVAVAEMVDTDVDTNYYCADCVKKYWQSADGQSELGAWDASTCDTDIMDALVAVATNKGQVDNLKAGKIVRGVFRE